MKMMQTVFPPQFDCIERYLIRKGDLVHIDFSPEIVHTVMNEIVILMFFERGPAIVFKFFKSLQPFLMENLFAEGFRVSLRDFYISRALIERVCRNIQKTSPLLSHLILNYNELVDLQIQKHVRDAKRQLEEFILSASCFGDLIDPKSESAMSKVVKGVFTSRSRSFLTRRIKHD